MKTLHPIPTVGSRRPWPSLARLAALAFTWLAAPVQAQSTLPFYEPFPSTYASGEQLGAANSSGLVWNFGNSTSSSCARVEPYAALAYPGLTNIDATTQSFGLSSYPKDTSSVKNRGAGLAITPGTTVYASCLINVQYYTNTAPWAFFGLNPANSGTPGAAGATVFFNPAGQLMVAKNSATPATNTTYSLTTANTHLVVLRYKYNTNSPDQVDLWLDPVSLGNDASIPAPVLTTTNNANVSSFGSVDYYQNALPSLFYLDEVRVAYDWAGVTPATPAAGRIFAVSGGGSGCAGDVFNVNLSGSDTGVTYLLYTNGVFNGQSLNGTGSALSFTGQSATALYTVLATNVTTGNAGWMSGSATISVLALPNIATQPSAVVVATNGLAAFTVYSAGNGLNFQWYRNGSALADGGHVTGSQTATLVISPATPAEAATKLNGYYVVVANRCGNGVISTTNELTLAAPASLLWSGDGASNLWEVAVATNWNYSASLGYNTAVFHYGDNVTFDDSSGNTTVNLTNANLSPGLITVNGSGSQNYTFIGGTLAGNGAILMNSAGTLNLDALNTLAGGLVVSNGTVAFGSPADLGSGAITLAGGELSPPGTGLVTVNNNLVVTGPGSVIGVNSPGGQPLILNGTLTGLGGDLTLKNITSKNAATAYAEFSATNLNFNLPVDLNNGTGSLLLMGLNGSGTQAWGGLLTDNGGVWRNASGGTTLLNNTNSYSGVTKLSAGAIGVGADSVVTTPPTVDAGPLGTGNLIIDTAPATMSLFASGAAHVVANPVSYTSNLLGSPLIINGNYALTLAGGFHLSGTNRVLEIDNTAPTILAGDITDDGLVNGLTKTGAGSLYLDGANDFTGVLTNSAGLLAGSGTVAGPVVVQSGATLGAGDAGMIPGTLTLNGGLTLSGNVLIRINTSQTQANDQLAVTGPLVNAGSGLVTISNTGPALPAGAAFTLFSGPVAGGNTLTVSGGGFTWSNHLAVDGGITAIAAVSSAPPVFLAPVVSGNHLVVGISNGAAGSTYYLLATTNLALPRASWTPVATNTYPGGVFYLTNTITPGVPNRFFLLSPNP